MAPRTHLFDDPDLWQAVLASRHVTAAMRQTLFRVSRASRDMVLAAAATADLKLDLAPYEEGSGTVRFGSVAEAPDPHSVRTGHARLPAHPCQRAPGPAQAA